MNLNSRQPTEHHRQWPDVWQGELAQPDQLRHRTQPAPDMSAGEANAADTTKQTWLARTSATLAQQLVGARAAKQQASLLLAIECHRLKTTRSSMALTASINGRDKPNVEQTDRNGGQT
jgi:hypothetical protein